MITILVTDTNNNPVDYAEVSIHWGQGGASTGRTSSSGQVSFKNLGGTIDRITANGKVCLSGPVVYNRDVSLTLQV